MRKRRRQSGQLFKAGGTWYVRYYDDRMVEGQLQRVRIAKQLCSVHNKGKRVPRKTVEEIAEKILNRINQHSQKPETAVLLADFVENHYLPRIAEQKRPSTYAGYHDMWENHLKPRCGTLLLRDIRTCDIQQLLDDLARDCTAMNYCAACGKTEKQHRGSEHDFDGTLSRNSLRHLKVALSGIFKYAKQLGFFDGENPVRDTAVPAARESGETHAYSIEEIAHIITHLPEPAATIFAVAAFTGARRGEIRGLLWENYDSEAIRITQSVWHGHITEPKTRKSIGTIPIIAPLAKRIELHRVRQGNPSSGPIFPNENRKPMDLNNLVNRVIVPALSLCRHCGKRRDDHSLAEHDFELDTSVPKWRGWHAARRGLGTNLYRLGVPEKTIQAILRHANVATTTAYYIKTAPADTRAAMKQLEAVLLGNEWAMKMVQAQDATIQ